ncbi:unnamed protein product, partial [Ectocarpus sp. 12 AP-2014]
FYFLFVCVSRAKTPPASAAFIGFVGNCVFPHYVISHAVWHVGKAKLAAATPTARSKPKQCTLPTLEETVEGVLHHSQFCIFLANAITSRKSAVDRESSAPGTSTQQ